MAGSFRGVAGKRASGARRFRGRFLPSGGRPSSGRSSSTSGRGDAPSSTFLGSPRSHPTPPHPDQQDPYARGRGGQWTPVVLLHGSSELLVAGGQILQCSSGSWSRWQRPRRTCAGPSSFRTVATGRSRSTRGRQRRAPGFLLAGAVGVKRLICIHPTPTPAHISLSRGAPSSSSAFLRATPARATLARRRDTISRPGRAPFREITPSFVPVSAMSSGRNRSPPPASPSARSSSASGETR